MRDALRLLLCFVFLTSMFTNESQAARKKVGQTGMQFLRIGIGARAAGIADASTSVINDLSAPFWNPGGLALAEASGIQIDQTNWIAGIRQYALAGALDLGQLGVVGLTFVGMDYPSMRRTVVDHEGISELGYLDLGEFNITEFAVGLAYSRRVTNKLSLGIHGKYVYQDLGENTIVNVRTGQTADVENKVTGIGFDFGTVYYTGFRSLRFAMVFQNFSRDFKYQDEQFPMPMIYKMGVAMDLADFWQGIKRYHSLTLAVDALHPRDYLERIHVGAEYWFRDIFALRTGYKFVYDEESLAAGFGFKYTLGGTHVRLDYAYTDFGDRFGGVNRFSFEVTF